MYLASVYLTFSLSSSKYINNYGMFSAGHFHHLQRKKYFNFEIYIKNVEKLNSPNFSP